MNRIFQGFAQTNPFSRGVLIIDENLTAKILRPERSQAVINHSPTGLTGATQDRAPHSSHSRYCSKSLTTRQKHSRTIKISNSK